MTKMAFYEYAAWIIGSVVCGGSIEAGGSSRGTSVDYTSPVEPLFCSEVAHAVAGMSRKEANVKMGWERVLNCRAHDIRKKGGKNDRQNF